MVQIAKLGCPAPPLCVADWVQGRAEELGGLKGRVVLIEVFQVNCPGCFLYSLPQSVDLFTRYRDKGLVVLGVATAFEDFLLNTLDNLKLLLLENKVVGETERVLQRENRLINGRLGFHIPFPVAMDNIVTRPGATTEDEVSAFIQQYITDIKGRTESEQITIRNKVLDHLNSRFRFAETFKHYNLQGTPSHIVIDKQGILKACEFGYFSDLEWVINSLLADQ